MNYIKVDDMRNLFFITSIVLLVFSSNLFAQPNNLVVGNITSNTVDLSWDASSCNANITLHYKIAGTPSWTIINSVTSPYTLTSLISSSTYEWRVKCAGSGNPWSTSSFTTLCTGVFGCTDMVACNYNASATCDDSSCFYPNVIISSFDTACNSYTWHDSTYDQSGVYTHAFFAAPTSTVSSFNGIIKDLFTSNCYYFLILKI